MYRESSQQVWERGLRGMSRCMQKIDKNTGRYVMGELTTQLAMEDNTSARVVACLTAMIHREAALQVCR